MIFFAGFPVLSNIKFKDFKFKNQDVNKTRCPRGPSHSGHSLGSKFVKFRKGQGIRQVKGLKKGRLPDRLNARSIDDGRHVYEHYELKRYMYVAKRTQLNCAECFCSSAALVYTIHSESGQRPYADISCRSSLSMELFHIRSSRFGRVK